MACQCACRLHLQLFEGVCSRAESTSSWLVADRRQIVNSRHALRTGSGGGPGVASGRAVLRCLTCQLTGTPTTHCPSQGLEDAIVGYKTLADGFVESRLRALWLPRLCQGVGEQQRVEEV